MQVHTSWKRSCCSCCPSPWIHIRFSNARTLWWQSFDNSPI